MQDKIVLAGMEFYAYHGVLPEERELGQPFRVSVHIYLPLQTAGQRDSLEETLDYRKTHARIGEIMTAPPVNLLETLAERVAEAVLAQEGAAAVYVEVEKTRPPLPGIMEGVKVCIRREKK